MALFSRFDKAVRKVDVANLVWPVAAAQIILIVAVALTVLLPREARISIEAETDIVSFDIPASKSFSGWGAFIAQSVVSPVGECKMAEVELSSEIKGPLKIDFQRTHDEKLVASFSGGKGQVLGNLKCPDGRHSELIEPTIFIWDATQAKRLVLPVVGSITVGDDVRTGMNDQLLLHNGRIVVEASSAPFKSGQVTRENRLFAGDRLYLSGDGEDEQAIMSHAVIRVGEEGKMNIVAHADAAQALVVHFGQDKASAASLAPTFLEKLQAQSQWALLLLIGAVLINVLKMVLEYVLSREKIPETQRRKKWKRYDR